MMVYHNELSLGLGFNLEPTPEQKEICAKARAAIRPLTPAERRAQRLSGTWGLLDSKSTLTKDDLDRMFKEQGY